MKTCLILFISTLSLYSFADHNYDPSTDTRKEVTTLLVKGLDPAIFVFNGGVIKIEDRLTYRDSTHHFNSDHVRALIVDAEVNTKVIDVYETCKIIAEYHSCTKHSPRIINFTNREPTEEERQNMARRKQDLTTELKEQVKRLTYENRALQRKIKELE